MKNLYILFFALTALLSSCGNNTNNSKANNNSNELRIISLVPSITLEIEQLGLKNNIVGATSYCEITKENPELIIGSAIEINEEKILLLKPDIVFSSTLTKPKSEKILRDNGIKVITMPRLYSFEDLCSHYIELGKSLDKEEDATNFVIQSKNKLDSIMASIINTGEKPRIFFQIGAKPIATVIDSTFMNDFIIFAKAENIFSDLDNIIVSRESVVLRNPSHIIISSMGTVGTNEKQVWNNYSDIDAVINNNIFVIDGATTPTVAAFIDNFEKIKTGIYKK